MNLESKLETVFKQFKMFSDAQQQRESTCFTDLQLLTDTTEEGLMEVRISHSLDPSQISLQLLNLQPCSQLYTFNVTQTTQQEVSSVNKHLSCYVCQFRTHDDREL